MDATRFDRLTRSLSAASSRRDLLRGVAGAALGIGATRFPDSVDARKKHKSKKPPLNQFGCLDVGKACNGNSGNCCSGICDGEKPNKGKPDQSRCVAHNGGDCQADQDLCLGDDSPCGTDAFCHRTTGKAGFCGNGTSAACMECQKDTDCEPTHGSGAACVVCAAECSSTGNTLCASPGA